MRTHTARLRKSLAPLISVVMLLAIEPASARNLHDLRDKKISALRGSWEQGRMVDQLAADSNSCKTVLEFRENDELLIRRIHCQISGNIMSRWRIETANDLDVIARIDNVKYTILISPNYELILRKVPTTPIEAVRDLFYSRPKGRK